MGGGADDLTLSTTEQKNLQQLPVDQLSFLDLLYAVPVADLATRISDADLRRVPLADWSALAVILAVIVLSWIGLHKNRTAMSTTVGRPLIGNISFFGLRFIQFLVEVIIIGLYFTMGLELRFPTSQTSKMASAPEQWITLILVLIYAAYLVWDIIDICQARGERDNPNSKAEPGSAQKWLDLAKAGAWITFVFLVLFGGFYAIALLANPRIGWAVALFNIGLLVFLWAYRVAQDRCGNTRA